VPRAQGALGQRTGLGSRRGRRWGCRCGWRGGNSPSRCRGGRCRRDSRRWRDGLRRHCRGALAAAHAQAARLARILGLGEEGGRGCGCGRCGRAGLGLGASAAGRHGSSGAPVHGSPRPRGLHTAGWCWLGLPRGRAWSRGAGPGSGWHDRGGRTQRSGVVGFVASPGIRRDGDAAVPDLIAEGFSGGRCAAMRPNHVRRLDQAGEVCDPPVREWALRDPGRAKGDGVGACRLDAGGDARE